MFQITQRILQDTEALLLNFPAQNKVWKWTTRHIVFPFKLLKLGSKDILKPASFWAILSFISIMLFTFFSQKIGIPVEYRGTTINITISVIMILAVFGIPSTYAFNGVKDKDVAKVRDIIQKEGIDTVNNTELVEENIERIFVRISSRVSFYKRLIGTFWTLYIVYFTIQMRFFLSANTEVKNSDLSSTLLYFFIFFLSSALLMFTIISYQRASEILIRTIEYACTQNKYELNLQNEEHD